MNMKKMLKNQKNPKPNKNKRRVSVFVTVKKLLDERDAKGRETYGGTLFANNGRNSIQDALEEALDLVVYLTQLAIEQKIIKQ
jgi:hypothetical protein